VPTSKSSTPKSPTSKPDAPEAPILAALHNIHIAYGSNSNSGSSSNTTTTRPVLSGLNWTIRAGERWHLQGANGSGKTTLLALLTGAHPLSYAQRPSAANGFKTQLVLFGRPRHMIPTAELARMVGLVSPELADSIPRAEGRTVWDVVGTGFEGTHVPRGNARVGDVAGDRAEEDRRVNRMWEVLKALGPVAWAPSTSTSSSVGNTNINTNINTNMNVSAVENGSTQVQTQKPIVAYPAATNVDSAPDAQTTVFARKPFARLSPGERSLVLLARALVGRPPLLILDEAWAGMDASMVSAARAYLRSEGGVAKGVLGQAVVVVSHWAGEVPWEGEEVRKIRLEEGMAIVDE
jgi:ABC-type molybdenum transport system ATPase subunit/photorepair protein PhrA